MRTRPWLLMLLAACGGQGEDTRDTVHPGEPTVRSRRVVLDSTTSEIEFLQYMIEHEWTIGGLLRRAEGRDLTDGAKAALKHAERHWFENEADLDGLEQFHGAEYEGALLGKLVGHYRDEVAAIDTALPRLRADHVRDRKGI